MLLVGIDLQRKANLVRNSLSKVAFFAQSECLEMK